MELYWVHKLEGDHAFLDVEESHHCLKVMRHKRGDRVEVTDGNGNKYVAVILNDDRNGCELQTIELLKSESQRSPVCHIAIAPTKSIDRFEWFLEKATEIGIAEITPLICRRSERTQLKPERLQKQVIAAMKQSQRCWLPILHEPQKFVDFILATGSGEPGLQPDNKIICYCGEETLPLLKNVYRLQTRVLILIGPEGDFSPDEVELALANGFSGATLGPARLRTETAGVVAAHTVQLMNS